jgi:hypothetical protein
MKTGTHTQVPVPMAKSVFNKLCAKICPRELQALPQ